VVYLTFLKTANAYREMEDVMCDKVMEGSFGIFEIFWIHKTHAGERVDGAAGD
jgi:hypothetical protein